MSAHRLIWPALAAVTAARLWVASQLEINPGEAYYWLCAERWEWAFFDGPGGTAALVCAGTELFGQTPLGLRFFFVLAAFVASIGAYTLGRWGFNSATGCWTAVVLNLLPGFNLAAVQAMPAVPTLACWLFAAAFTWRALGSGNRTLPAWFGAGLSLALGLQFSYWTAAALVPLLLYPLSLARLRPRLMHAGPWLAIAMAAAGAAPAIAWNIANDWAPAALGTFRTAISVNPLQLGKPAFDAFLAISPLVVPAALFLLVESALRSRAHLRPRFFFLWSLAPFLLWFYAALRGWSLPIEAVLSVALIAPAGIAMWLANRGGACAVSATAVVLSAALASFAVFCAPERSIAAIFQRDTLGGWKAATAAVLEIRQEAQTAAGPDPVFVIAKDPAMTAALAFQAASVNPTPEIFLRESQDLSNQFGLWPRYDDFVETVTAPDEFFEEVRGINPYMGRSALYVTDETPQELPQTITGAFSRVTPAARVEIRRGGKPIRELRTYFCEDYQTMPL